MPHPLEEQLPSLPHLPGVYRFVDAGERVLYVGKAKDLRKRVSSYFNRSDAPARIQVMLAQAQKLELTVTTTENEALILEASLIKGFKPRYNVLLKDDKSYPYLRLTTGQAYPRLSLYRGDRQEPGRYFGPYPSSVAVRETLKILQRIFPVRQCEDGQFQRRERPCLQYQIRRCAGPCCGRVEEERYAAWVRQVVLFLEGKDRQLVESLRQEMWQAAEARRFEEAGELRDRIHALEHVQEQRRLNLSGGGEMDVIALAGGEGVWVVQVFFVRDGVNLGNREFFPAQVEEIPPEEILSAFVPQFYADKSPPPEILLPFFPEDAAWLGQALGERRGGRVVLRAPRRGEKRALVEMALVNARQSLERHLSGRATLRERLRLLAEELELDGIPERIEAYDVSHIQDAHPVGSMVVFGPEGFRKGSYRKFALEPELADDTARMGEMLRRRLQRLAQEGEEAWPDLILLDGGLGQLGAVRKVAESLGVAGIPLCAMAKGPDRNAGNERLFLPQRAEPIMLSNGAPVSFLLQNVRDEAHRFAVGYHRTRRGQAQTRSALDDVSGIGAQRKKALLRRFGSVRAIRESNVEELSRVEGISKGLAERILRALRNLE